MTENMTQPVTAERIQAALDAMHLRFNLDQDGDAFFSVHVHGTAAPIFVGVWTIPSSHVLELHARLAATYDPDAMPRINAAIISEQCSRVWVRGFTSTIDGDTGVKAIVQGMTSVPVRCGASDAQLTEWIDFALGTLASFLDAVDAAGTVPALPADVPTAEELETWLQG